MSLKTGMFSESIEEFVVAAERLMVNDVQPETLPHNDIEAIRFYVKSLTEKFLEPSSIIPTSGYL